MSKVRDMAAQLPLVSGQNIKTVNVQGSVVGGFSGLTPGTVYYANYDGTLTATVGTTGSRVGTAVDTTRLLVTL